MPFIYYTDIIANRESIQITPWSSVPDYSGHLSLAPLPEAIPLSMNPLAIEQHYIILFHSLSRERSNADQLHINKAVLDTVIRTDLAIILLMWVCGENVMWMKGLWGPPVLSEAERGFMNHGDAKTCMLTSLAHCLCHTERLLHTGLGFTER